MWLRIWNAPRRVVDDFLGEAIELFLRREDAERMVDDRDGNEPDDAAYCVSKWSI